MYKLFTKRIIDFLAAMIGFIVLLPIFLLVTFLLYFANNGKPFFFQKRPGKNEKIFSIIKFKTMNDKKDAQGNLLTDAERLTKIGLFVRKTSLDELPQIFNIFLGQMSLIGPRPYMVEERMKLGEDSETILWVKPGLTGLWQVSGRNNLTFDKRKELDIWYIQNWSLWIDFIVLVKTIKVVLFKKGAS